MTNQILTNNFFKREKQHKKLTLNTVPYIFFSFQSPRLTKPDFLNIVAKESESSAGFT